ncbi:hypothetical protein SAMN04515647_1595 [Cohaesibacter sp. ES.047]|nr:hypothetical protein SAMN04515647_1595 [Cohaesibacter sp. ES.047]
MPLLTELQINCLKIMQRRNVACGAETCSRVSTIAWELGKTTKQATDCLSRLNRKELVKRTGVGLWSLTSQGLQYKIDLPPGE